MAQFYRMLSRFESNWFLYINIRWNRAALTTLFRLLSLIGGATFSLCVSLAVGLLADGIWRTAGWQALAAVVISHIPVALAKRLSPRSRPYQVLPQARTGPRPLQDPSFPSGHTTAAFALLTPWMVASPALIPLLLPIGAGVALSRVYFGLHYPSDTVAGMLLGTATALLAGVWIHAA
ncbi:phosphatase PAP2 family protein [Cohnella sp. GbtcB17]|uniref:phosphatase PAP2 family protein n=1 Tax=Cohnella sp. GbtcB17 TaxID=2824762 RepID=UPI001C30D186|nr:phosphatase PAP2 family protein [Cohnella sp. GbtcB17]